MKLQKRLKQTLAMTAVATTLFSAVPAFAADYQGHWAEKTINEWKDKGVIDGYEDGSFKPKQEVTRAELAKMLVEVFGLTHTEGAEKFSDVAGDAWYAQHVKLVSAAGLMTGTNGNFRPSEVATREEAAYAMATAYHITGTTKETFKDQAAISTWAADAVEALVAGGYINGYPDGTFKPQGTLTRAEAVTMLDKITADIYNAKGTYTKDTQGNVVVNAKDVVLKDMTINGNLYLAEGIGEGCVTLENVTVTGDIIVEGGSAESIHIKGKSKVKNIVTSKAGTKPVKIVISGTATVAGEIKVNSNTVIEGSGIKVDQITAVEAETLEIKGNVEVATLTIDSKLTLTLDKNVKVKTLNINKDAEATKLAGKGTIETLNVNANKVVYAGTLDIQNIKVDPSVTEGPEKQSAGGGGGGGGSTGGGGTVVDKNLNIHTINVYVDGEEAPRKIDVSDDKIVMNVDLEAGTTTVDGVTFDTEDTLTGVSATANVEGSVNVSVPGATKIGYEMTFGRKYNVLDLSAIMDENIEAAKGIIESLGLDEEQEKEAIRLMGEVQKVLKQLVDPTVTGAELAEQAQVVKNKLNDPDVVAAYGKVKDKLAAYGGFDVKWNDNDTITITGTVHATRSGYELEKTTVEVTF